MWQLRKRFRSVKLNKKISHCYFVSNCIGQRNIKSFLIFLIFGTLTGLIITITSFIHLIYNLFFFEGKITIEIYDFYPVYTIIALILFLLSLILFWLQIFPPCYITPLLIISNGLIIILFYLTTEKINKSFPDYYNPFSILILTGSIPLTTFVSIFNFKQLGLISKGLNTKQYESIIKESVNNKNVLAKEYIIKRNLSLCSKIKNIAVFISKNQMDSLVTIDDL